MYDFESGTHTAQRHDVFEGKARVTMSRKRQAACYEYTHNFISAESDEEEKTSMCCGSGSNLVKINGAPVTASIGEKCVEK